MIKQVKKTYLLTILLILTMTMMLIAIPAIYAQAYDKTKNRIETTAYSNFFISSFVGMLPNIKSHNRVDTPKALYGFK